MPNRVTYVTSLLILSFLKGPISRIYYYCTILDFLDFVFVFLCFKFHLLFVSAIDLLYRDVELNPGLARSYHMGRVLFSNIRGLYKNLKDLI